MSRTMKPEEAIMALAFLSNPEELTKTANLSIVRDDSFGEDFRGILTKGLTKLVSEKSLDLYSTGDRASIYMNNNHNHNNHSKDGTASTSTPNSELGTCSDQQIGVSFGTVEVRKYPITIGANPSVSRGVPRTIEWDHLEDETERHHIDAYERERPNEERKRGEELLLNGVTRAKMLTNLGYTKTQFFEGIRWAKEHCSNKISSIGASRSSSSKNSARGVYQRRNRDPRSLRWGSK